VIFFAAFALSLFRLKTLSSDLSKKNAALEEVGMAYYASEEERAEMFAAMDWMAHEQMRMEWEMRLRDIKRDNGAF
jgi:hypothetical protein